MAEGSLVVAAAAGPENATGVDTSYRYSLLGIPTGESDGPLERCSRLSGSFASFRMNQSAKRGRVLLAASLALAASVKDNMGVARSVRAWVDGKIVGTLVAVLAEAAAGR